MLRAIPFALAAFGLALGLFLDHGLAALLPCDPWPAPTATGFGGLIGGGIGLLAGFGVARAARALPAQDQTVRILAAALGFVLAITVMTGALGYASGQRDAADRDLAALRDVRRDLDKKLVDADKGAAAVARLEESVAHRRDDHRAFRGARQGAGIGAILASLLAGVFASLAIQYAGLKQRLDSQAAE